MITTDTVNNKVKKGNYYTATRTASVNNSASMLILIAVGTVPIHLMFDVEMGGLSTISFAEGVTTSADGTGITSFNMNRNSSNTATATITYTPTITGAGTTIQSRTIAGSTQPRTRGDVKGQAEWILKPSTKYAIQITNSSGGALYCGIDLEWYEDKAGEE